MLCSGNIRHHLSCWLNLRGDRRTLFFHGNDSYTRSRQLAEICSNNHCCGTVTIFYGSGSGSDFWKVMVPVPVPTFEKVMVPVPVPTFEKLRFRFRFQLHIYTIKSKFFLTKLFLFYIVSCFTRKKIININKFIVKCERKKCWMKVIKYIILYLVPVPEP